MWRIFSKAHFVPKYLSQLSTGGEIPPFYWFSLCNPALPKHPLNLEKWLILMGDFGWVSAPLTTKLFCHLDLSAQSCQEDNLQMISVVCDNGNWSGKYLWNSLLREFPKEKTQEFRILETYTKVPFQMVNLLVPILLNNHLNPWIARLNILLVGNSLLFIALDFLKIYLDLIF